MRVSTPTSAENTTRIRTSAHRIPLKPWLCIKILAEIQRVTEEAKQHREQFLQRAMDRHSSQLKKEPSVKTRELEKARKRLGDLDTLFRKAFEQLALGTSPKCSLNL